MTLRKSVGKLRNHITGVDMDIVKLKPNTDIRAMVNLELINVKTGDIELSMENIENVRKQALVDVASVITSMHYNPRNSSTGVTDSTFLHEMQIIYDVDNIETDLYNVNEGTVVGFASLDVDYGGGSIERGNRNASLSGVFVDEITNEIVFRTAAIFDETRINDQPINKIALCNQQSYDSIRYDNASSNTNNGNPIFTGTGYRYIEDGKNTGRWGLYITPDVFLTEYIGKDAPIYESFAKAYGSKFFSIDPNLSQVTLTLRVMDTSIMPTTAIFDITQMQVISLAPIDNVVELIDTATFTYNATAKTIKYIKMVGRVITIATYDVTDFLSIPAALSVKTYTVTAPEIGHSKICAIEVDGYVEVFYTPIKGMVRIRMDDTSILQENETSILVEAVHVVRLSADVYTMVTATNKSRADDYTYSWYNGGYVDIATSRYIDSFAIAPGVSNSSGNPARHPRAIPYSLLANTGDYVQFFCYDTGRIYTFSQYSSTPTTIAIPVEYVPPRHRMFVDTLPEFTKANTQQLRISYEIRCPNTVPALSNPFDKVYGLSAGEALSYEPLYGNRLNDRQEYRLPLHTKNDRYLRLTGPIPANLYAGGVPLIFYIEPDGLGGMRLRVDHNPKGLLISTYVDIGTGIAADMLLPTRGWVTADDNVWFTTIRRYEISDIDPSTTTYTRLDNANKVMYMASSTSYPNYVNRKTVNRWYYGTGGKDMSIKRTFGEFTIDHGYEQVDTFAYSGNLAIPVMEGLSITAKSVDRMTIYQDGIGANRIWTFRYVDGAGTTVDKVFNVPVDWPDDLRPYISAVARTGETATSESRTQANGYSGSFYNIAALGYAVGSKVTITIKPTWDNAMTYSVTQLDNSVAAMATFDIDFV